MKRSPRIVFITPDALFRPWRAKTGLKRALRYFCTPGEDNAGFLGHLISDLSHLGIDVHVVQPNYRRIFECDPTRDGGGACGDMPVRCVHLAQDRIFYYAERPAESGFWDTVHISIALQRETIHRWVPELRPDLVHCHDWMCGLIPAAAEFLGATSLFAVSDLRTSFIPVKPVEIMGLDIAPFWQKLYYLHMPHSYAEVRHANRINMLASGIWAASNVNLSSERAAHEFGCGEHGRAKGYLRTLLRQKAGSGRITRIGGPHFSTDDYIGLYQSILQRDLVL